MRKKKQLLCGSKIIGMIPARYESSRFPGKMLAPIQGISLIQRTYESTKRCVLLDHVLIATDDQRIYQHVKGFGAEAIMTSKYCPTGTDRLAEALAYYPDFDETSLVINIQGDEPCIDPTTIEKVINILQQSPDAVMSTAATKIRSAEDAHSASVVKCVMDNLGNALYFSRNLIPAGHAREWSPGCPVYRHLGIYGFRPHFLLKFASLPKTPLQMAEDLEMLKVLENGFKIKVALVEHESIGVDLPGDIKKVEQWLCKQNISL
jgi:3-deoxy-manno-octulosonate cytidylyltransferase (CMP-KDO synthetase)